MKILSALFLFFGSFLLLFSAYLLYLRFAPHPISFEKIPNQSYTKGKVIPSNIIIPSIGVNLPIISSQLRENSWVTTTLGVSYLTSTPIPGKTGNSVFYGHNWKSLLGNLSKVKPGEKVFINFNNGQKKEFTVENTAVVDQDRMDVVKNTEDTRITIYTCTGFLDSKRFVVVAKPSS